MENKVSKIVNYLIFIKLILYFMRTSVQTVFNEKLVLSFFINCNNSQTCWKYETENK